MTSCGTLALLCFLHISSSQAQQSVRPRAAAGESVLERRYKAAQTFQASRELDKAAEQYRIFIADTLGQIALVRARAGESDRATKNFDQALKLVPAFPSLQLEYARVSLDARRPEKAKQLAADVVRQQPADAMIAAKAMSCSDGRC